MFAFDLPNVAPFNQGNLGNKSSMNHTIRLFATVMQVEQIQV